MLNKVYKYLSKKKIVGVFIELIGVILIWRGIWGVLDKFLFPNNPLISYIICILFGFFLVWFDDKKLDEFK